MSELMEALEARMLLGGNPFDAPELPITFANVRITLLQEEAPRAVKSFLELRDQGKLKDVIVHRDSPGSKVARAGLFRHASDGLEFAPRHKRIDDGRSLPTIAGTVAFRRDPERPGRTTGEIVFLKEDRRGSRKNLVVFGRFTSLRSGAIFFDLRDHADVERADLLDSVPASGGTFQDPFFHEFGLGSMIAFGSQRRIGGIATPDTAEWVTITNRSSSIQPFEIVVVYSNPDLTAVLARGFVRPGKSRLVQLHVGANVADVDRREFFGATNGEVVVASGLRRNRPYSLTIRGLGHQAVLQRVERDPEFGVVRSMRITNDARVRITKSFGVVDLRNDGARSRIVVQAGSSQSSRVVITGVNERNESVSIERTIGAGRIVEIDLDGIEGVAGEIVRLSLRVEGGALQSALLIDGKADFASVNRADAISKARPSRFMQRRLGEGNALRFLVFNPSFEDVTVEPVVSLVQCMEHRECPDDPPDVPRLEALDVAGGSFAWYPIEGDLIFDRDYVFRLTSSLGMEVYFDPSVLTEL